MATVSLHGHEITFNLWKPELKHPQTKEKPAKLSDTICLKPELSKLKLTLNLWKSDLKCLRCWSSEWKTAAQPLQVYLYSTATKWSVSSTPSKCTDSSSFDKLLRSFVAMHFPISRSSWFPNPNWNPAWFCPICQLQGTTCWSACLYIQSCSIKEVMRCCECGFRPRRSICSPHASNPNPPHDVLAPRRGVLVLSGPVADYYLCCIQCAAVWRRPASSTAAAHSSRCCCVVAQGCKETPLPLKP